MDNGNTAVDYYFSLHADDDARTQLVHEVDGVKVPVVFKAVTIIEAANIEAPKIILPNNGIVH